MTMKMWLENIKRNNVVQLGHMWKDQITRYR